jgi:hypothetical protein
LGSYGQRIGQPFADFAGKAFVVFEGRELRLPGRRGGPPASSCEPSAWAPELEFILGTPTRRMASIVEDSLHIGPDSPVLFEVRDGLWRKTLASKSDCRFSFARAI